VKTIADCARRVPLGEIRGVLERAGHKVESETGVIRFQGRFGPAEIRVLAPQEPPLDECQMEAVIVARTRLPDSVPAGNPDTCAYLNCAAALGALANVNGAPWVVSRLTTYEGEHAWGLHGLLVARAAAISPDALFPGKQASSGSRDDREAWPEADFAQLQARFGGRFHCSTWESSFTAEFALRNGSGAAALGDEHTALLTMKSVGRHPALGLGLQVLLELPHRFDRIDRLPRLIADLNAWEAQPGDMVPHYGAWCYGHLENPAYTAFYPRDLWVEGLATKVFTWMLARARMADGFLAARGVKAGHNEACRRSPYGR